MSDWYVREIVESGKQPLAILFGMFVLTFLFIRLSVRMIRAEVSWWPGNVKPGGMHLHHVVFGIVFMLVAGVGGFSTIGYQQPWSEIFAGLFGCGAALVLDEFALVLHLRDVYWTEQGRASVNAVFLAVAVFGLLLVGSAPFGVNEVAQTRDEFAAWNYTWAIATNSILVILTLLKGKFWTGVLGVLFPLFALVGAIRLARPASIWARWRYKPGSRRERRAIRRDVHLRQRFVRFRTHIQDALAGRPN